MELPSIKFNIFKKLEYYQVLLQLNNKFEAQLDMLKKNDWDEVKSKYKGTYPSWEIEKKILFWTYIRHKHLGRPISRGHMKDMFVSDEELRRASGIEIIFENLEKGGFGQKTEKDCRNGGKELACVITKEGLEFGELLWYSCNLKKYYLVEGIKKPNDYANIFRADYRLNNSWWGKTIFNFQFFSLYCFIIIAVALFILEFLNVAGLLDNLKNMVVIFLNKFGYYNFRNIIVLVIIVPFIFFCVSLIIDLIYRFFLHRWKYKLYLRN